MQVFGADAARIGLLVHLFQLGTGRLGGAFLQVQDLVVLDLDDGGEARHVFRVQAVPDGPFHEEDLRVGMVHQVVDVPGLELVEQRDGNGPVGHGGQVMAARKQTAQWAWLREMMTTLSPGTTP